MTVGIHLASAEQNNVDIFAVNLTSRIGLNVVGYQSNYM